MTFPTNGWKTMLWDNELPKDLESIRISSQGDVGVWQRIPNGGGWRATNVWRDGSTQQAVGRTKQEVRRKLAEQRR